MTKQRITSLVPRRTADVIPAGGEFDFSRYQPGDTIVVTYAQQIALGSSGNTEEVALAILRAAHKSGLSAFIELDTFSKELRVSFDEASNGRD